jgi:hypothetical protein
MVIDHRFGEVASLTEQHAALSGALRDVFEDLLTKVQNTTAEGIESPAYQIFHEVKNAWNDKAQDWVNSQGDLAKAVNMHNEDFQASEAGPISGVFKDIGMA